MYASKGMRVLGHFPSYPNFKNKSKLKHKAFRKLAVPLSSVETVHRSQLGSLKGKSQSSYLKVVFLVFNQ
jgi:hypothetical protein